MRSIRSVPEFRPKVNVILSEVSRNANAMRFTQLKSLSRVTTQSSVTKVLEGPLIIARRFNPV